MVHSSGSKNPQKGGLVLKWQTHLAGGLAVGALVSTTPTAIIISGISALLPDIDKFNSKMGRAAPLLSIPISIIFGHRGLLHSLLAAGLIYLLTLKLLPTYSLYCLAGYLSHLLLDCLTPSGVPLLWPVPFRFRIPVIKTGSMFETALFFCIIILFVKEVFL